jgi:hypothetical protein
LEQQSAAVDETSCGCARAARPAASPQLGKASPPCRRGRGQLGARRHIREMSSVATGAQRPQAAQAPGWAAASRRLPPGRPQPAAPSKMTRVGPTPACPPGCRLRAASPQAFAAPLVRRTTDGAAWCCLQAPAVTLAALLYSRPAYAHCAITCSSQLCLRVGLILAPPRAPGSNCILLELPTHRFDTGLHNCLQHTTPCFAPVPFPVATPTPSWPRQCNI